VTRDEFVVALASVMAPVARARRRVPEALKGVECAERRVADYVYTAGALAKAGGAIPKADLDGLAIATAERWRALAEGRVANDAARAWRKTVAEQLDRRGGVRAWWELPVDPASHFNQLEAALRARLGAPQPPGRFDPPSRHSRALWWVRQERTENRRVSCAVREVRAGLRFEDRGEDGSCIVLVAWSQGDGGEVHSGDMLLRVEEGLVRRIDSGECTLPAMREASLFRNDHIHTRVTTAGAALAAVDLVLAFRAPPAEVAATDAGEDEDE